MSLSARESTHRDEIRFASRPQDSRRRRDGEAPKTLRLFRAALLAALACTPSAGALAQGPRWQDGPGMTPRTGFAVARDEGRGRLVLFGGTSTADLSRLDDTWEWDGSSWQRLLPVHVPPPRDAHAMAYDRLRRRIVMFGGDPGSAGSLHADTWEWDGVDWTLRDNRPSGPGGRAGHALVYDPILARVLLIGGGGGARDVWAWDGALWTQRVPTGGTPFFSGSGAVFDEARRRVVVFGGSYGNGTWEWDGFSWAQRFPVTSPPGRSFHGMAWDRGRQRTVVYGGQSRNDVLDDLWEWDGTTWKFVVSGVGPGPRTCALAYDSAAGSVVLFGGLGDVVTRGLHRALTDTWSWNGTGWTLLQGSIHATTRGQTAMAHSWTTGRTLMFGGRAPYARDDTWEWDGAGWRTFDPTPRPSPRYGHGIVYDVVRNRAILFGGHDEASRQGFDDTWQWVGARWTRLSPGVRPGARADFGIAYDIVRDRVVMYGGRTATLRQDETWEWDGTSWAQRTPATNPGPRTAHGLAYDAARRRVVLFGGHAGLNLSDETWEWDGAVWIQRQPATIPPARWGHAMTTDLVRNRVVLHGGSSASGTLLADTWEWDGTDWTMTAVGTPRRGHALAFDILRRQVIAYGGDGILVAPNLEVYGTPAPSASTTLGLGCGGPGGIPQLTSSVPFFGNPGFRCEVAAGPAGSVAALGFAAQNGAVSLGAGCTLYLAGSMATVGRPTNNVGFASLTAPIPSDPGLRGAVVWTQAFALDPRAPLFGVSMTAARRLLIGN